MNAPPAGRAEERCDTAANTPFRRWSQARAALFAAVADGRAAREPANVLAAYDAAMQSLRADLEGQDREVFDTAVARDRDWLLHAAAADGASRARDAEDAERSFA